jgi:hypothetical protein
LRGDAVKHVRHDELEMAAVGYFWRETTRRDGFHDVSFCQHAVLFTIVERLMDLFQLLEQL